MVFSSRKIYADNLSRLAFGFKIRCELVLDQYHEIFDESGQRSLLLEIICRPLWHIKFVIWIILLFVSYAPWTNSYEKRKLFTSQLFLGLQFLCSFGALQTKLKKYSTLKKLYVGSNRLFKKIHHFRDPTLGTLGEWLVGKLRILKVLESLYVGEAQTRFHPLPLPQSRARDRLFWGYFR